MMKQNANTASEGMKVYKKSDRAKAKTKLKRFFTFRKPKKKILIMWRHFREHFMTSCSETLLKLNYKDDMYHLKHKVVTDYCAIKKKKKK